MLRKKEEQGLRGNKIRKGKQYKMKNENSEGMGKKPRKNGNREILAITYFFVLLFVGMGVYYGIFIQGDAKEIVNNSYNKRGEMLEERVIRGKILGSGGEVLAETVVEEDGKTRRNYPYNDLFSHVVGRVERGRTGIESAQNITLVTSTGNIFINALTQMRGEKLTGDSVVTTLDVRLQRAAYSALGDQRGAVVAIEPSTGRILCMVSKPDYDPNSIEKYWDELNNDTENSPLLNRATFGLYPPGSTFKVLTSLSYIRQNGNYKDYEYDCAGSGIFSSVSINCYDRRIHGHEDLIASFANSCNTSYANIGLGLNLSEYKNVCESFLFNKALPTDLSANESSFVIDENSNREDLPQTAIGQGKTQITPIHNCMIAATIANNGTMMCPYVVDHIEAFDGSISFTHEPVEYAKLLKKKEVNYLKKMMESVVTEGTGSPLNYAGYSVAGKTGSAEFDSTKATHSWFIGYAPADDPKIAISVIVENSGYGNVYSMPVVRSVLDEFFAE